MERDTGGIEGLGIPVVVRVRNHITFSPKASGRDCHPRPARDDFTIAPASAG